MKASLLGVGPGDPELLTVKAMRLLTETKICLVSFKSIDERILQIASKNAELIDVSNKNAENVLSYYERFAAEDVNFVHLFLGDPCLYEHLQHCIAWLRRKAIAYEVVPGISAYQALAAAVGTELTIYGESQSIAVTRVKGQSYMPLEQEIVSMAASKTTLCIYFAGRSESNDWIPLEKYYGSNCPAIIGEAVGTKREKIEKTTVGNLGQYFNKNLPRANIPGIVIVGEALKDAEYLPLNRNLT